MVVEGSPFFYVKIDYYVTSVLCNVRLLFFALPCIYEKKFVPLQRETHDRGLRVVGQLYAPLRTNQYLRIYLNTIKTMLE